MDRQRQWFAERRAQLHAELRHAEMMRRASRNALQWEAKIDALHIKLNRLTALED